MTSRAIDCLGLGAVVANQPAVDACEELPPAFIQARVGIHGYQHACCPVARGRWWCLAERPSKGDQAGHGVDLPAGGPVARTGRAQVGWHYYLAPAGLTRRSGVLDRVDNQGRGAYVVAPPSRHASGRPYRWVRDLDHPLPPVPEQLRVELERALPQPAGPVVVGLPPADGPGPTYVRSALATELARVATAPQGRRKRQLWESARNPFNFVAVGALDQAEVERGLLQAAERCGLLAEELHQTHRTLASARQVGLEHPRHPPQRPTPNRNPSHASPPPATPGSRRADAGGEVMAMAGAGHPAG